MASRKHSCHPLSTSVSLPLWEPVNVYVTRSGHARWGCLLTGDGGPWIQSHSAFRSVPAGGAHSEVMWDATSQNSHQRLCTSMSGGWQEDSQWPWGAVQCDQRPFWRVLRGPWRMSEVMTVTGRGGGCPHNVCCADASTSGARHPPP